MGPPHTHEFIHQKNGIKNKYKTSYAIDKKQGFWKFPQILFPFFFSRFVGLAMDLYMVPFNYSPLHIGRREVHVEHLDVWSHLSSSN